MEAPSDGLLAGLFKPHYDTFRGESVRPPAIRLRIEYNSHSTTRHEIFSLKGMNGKRSSSLTCRENLLVHSFL